MPWPISTCPTVFTYRTSYVMPWYTASLASGQSMYLPDNTWINGVSFYVPDHASVISVIMRTKQLRFLQRAGYSWLLR